MHANFVHRHAMWSSNAIKQGRAAGLHDEAEAINNIEDSERPTMLALVYDSQYTRDMFTSSSCTSSWCCCCYCFICCCTAPASAVREHRHFKVRSPPFQTEASAHQPRVHSDRLISQLRG